ncbi:zinc transporter [Actinomyces gaoshouyii]|uniref:zinc transporter n=1 Tax=Actinomyces gaoshouyii TaxID=1960083 RepID=UPI0013DE1CC2|nr:zinc transporter [Actinomyces gaoshouyii]
MTEEVIVRGDPSSSDSETGGGGGQVVVSAAQPQSAPIEGDFICDGQDPQGNDTGACRFQPTPTRPTAPAPDPATTTPPPLIVTAHDIATLIVDGSGITLQPPGNTILLHMPLIAHTNPATRTLTTTIANTTIDIEATPTTYTWNWGDNTTTTTTDPGHPYPNHTITHQYTTTNNNTTITLTTTWTARYKPTNTTNWKPITGYITTTQTTPPLTIHRLTPYLTNDTQHHH